MVDPARPSTVDWTPALAWLQRCARVPTRVGQVWSRQDSYPETILIVGGPAIVKSVNHGPIASILGATCRSGWEHLVYSLDRGSRFFLNENWFHESEIGRGSVWRME